MREIVIISGKGGTGKTSLTGAFAHLAKNKIICDLDVDAPDLHLITDPETVRKEDFISGNEAIIDESRCSGCGTCAEMCTFEAVEQKGGVYAINPLRCEGCKVCVEFCPEQAIDFPDRHCGSWSISETRFGTMVHAQLFPGEENSGRLVTLLKQEAKNIAEEKGYDLVLCDGAPGIGCPVISSLAGVDMAVVVTEPTPSGRHDLERVGELCAHFKVKVAVILNKCDLNPDQAESIEDHCREKGYELVAKLPHDACVTRAMIGRQVVTEADEGEFARKVRDAWRTVEELAKQT